MSPTLKRLIVFAIFTIMVGMSSAEVATSQVGVVLMHGKWGTSKAKSPVGKLQAALKAEGFIVIAPDLPWSRSRFLDRDVDETMAEIDKYVKKLKAMGATKIVIGGLSIGANMALAYGSRRGRLAGILAIAPGHVPELSSWRNHFEVSVKEAREKLANGKGNSGIKITDNNQGKKKNFILSARIIASWYSPDGDAVMPINAIQLKKGTPLLWIIGEKDGLSKRGRAYAFNRAPLHPYNRYIVVKGGHKDTSVKGRAEIIKWLKGL